MQHRTLWARVACRSFPPPRCRSGQIRFFSEGGWGRPHASASCSPGGRAGARMPVKRCSDDRFLFRLVHIVTDTARVRPLYNLGLPEDSESRGAVLSGAQRINFSAMWSTSLGQIVVSGIVLGNQGVSSSRKWRVVPSAGAWHECLQNSRAFYLFRSVI